MPPQVHLPPEPVPIEPGGRAVIEAVVLNPADHAERYTAAVLGSAESWATVEPPAVAVPAWGRSMIAIHLHPPRAPHVRSGTTPVGLLLECPATREHATAEGLLEIAEFRVLDVELFPEHRHGRSASFGLILTNRGNAVARCSLSGRSDSGDLSVSCVPEALVVPPGTEVSGRVRVRAVNGWRAVEATRTFRVVVQTRLGDPVAVSGTLASPSLIARRRSRPF